MHNILLFQRGERYLLSWLLCSVTGLVPLYQNEGKGGFGVWFQF